MTPYDNVSLDNKQLSIAAHTKKANKTYRNILDVPAAISIDVPSLSEDEYCIDLSTTGTLLTLTRRLKF